jgi:dUTPase
MKKLIFACLTLTALGAATTPLKAQEQTQVEADTAVMQTVTQEAIQTGENNEVLQRGTMLNRSSNGGVGSIGIVQDAYSGTVQEGTGNRSRQDFRIENRSSNGPARVRRSR